MSKRVVVYRKPSCVPCQGVKQWLESKGIPYEEVSAFDNPDAARIAKIRSVPTTVLMDGADEVGRVVGLKAELMQDVFGYGTAG